MESLRYCHIRLYFIFGLFSFLLRGDNSFFLRGGSLLSSKDLRNDFHCPWDFLRIFFLNELPFHLWLLDSDFGNIFQSLRSQINRNPKIQYDNLRQIEIRYPIKFPFQKLSLHTQKYLHCFLQYWSLITSCKIQKNRPPFFLFKTTLSDGISYFVRKHKKTFFIILIF